MFEKFHIYITLIAALITTVFSILFYDSLIRLAISVIVTIVVFYIIGSFVKEYLIKLFTPPEEEEQDIDESAEENDESDEIFEEVSEEN